MKKTILKTMMIHVDNNACLSLKTLISLIIRFYILSNLILKFTTLHYSRRVSHSAALAQLVEHFISNEKVRSSNLRCGNCISLLLFLKLSIIPKTRIKNDTIGNHNLPHYRSSLSCSLVIKRTVVLIYMTWLAEGLARPSPPRYL